MFVHVIFHWSLLFICFPDMSKGYRPTIMTRVLALKFSKNNMVTKGYWVSLVVVLSLTAFSLGSEECQGMKNGETKPEASDGSTCGCAATSRQKIENPDSSTTKEEPEEAPNFKYTLEANRVPSIPNIHHMVKIPGGEFIMGTNEPVFEADGEHPARRVKVKEFYMDTYEVSNMAFELFVKATGYKTEVIFFFFFMHPLASLPCFLYFSILFFLKLCQE